MIDQQNLSQKEFVKTDCKNHDTLLLLEKLNFGKVPNLIKNPNRNLTFINYMNEMLSRKETQTYLNDNSATTILPSSFDMTSYSPPTKVSKISWTENSIVHGLENIGGVSCYFNAALQLLFHVKCFVEQLKDFDDSSNEWFSNIKSLYEQLKSQTRYRPSQEFSEIVESESMKYFRNPDNNEPCQGKISIYFSNNIFT